MQALLANPRGFCAGVVRAIVEALKQRFPEVRGPEVSDICYATQNRQSAYRILAARADVILVVGARNSSNSARLREVGEMSGVSAYLIQDADEISPGWFVRDSRIGVTAGASPPPRCWCKGCWIACRSLGWIRPTK